MPIHANAPDFSQNLRNFDLFTGLPGQLLDSPEFPNFSGKYLSWIFIFLCRKHTVYWKIQKLDFQKLDCVHETWNNTNIYKSTI